MNLLIDDALSQKREVFFGETQQVMFSESDRRFILFLFMLAKISLNIKRNRANQDILVYRYLLGFFKKRNFLIIYYKKKKGMH